MGSGFVKIAYFCYNSASSRFYREILYGQVAQSVEQRIENSPGPQKPSKSIAALASQKSLYFCTLVRWFSFINNGVETSTHLLNDDFVELDVSEITKSALTS